MRMHLFPTGNRQRIPGYQKAILCCKTCHARRALMYYKLLYPDTEFFVSSCCVDSIDKNTWIMTNDGIDEVMEITRIIKQFSLMLKKLI